MLNGWLARFRQCYLSWFIHPWVTPFVLEGFPISIFRFSDCIGDISMTKSSSLVLKCSANDSHILSHPFVVGGIPWINLVFTPKSRWLATFWHRFSLGFLHQIKSTGIPWTFWFSPLNKWLAHFCLTKTVKRDQKSCSNAKNTGCFQLSCLQYYKHC